MLVEDTTAFIEQLEVRREDKRAEKQRRRQAHAEVAVLRAECERRLASDALSKMQQELASISTPLDAGPGRRLLVARRRRALEHRIQNMRDRVRAMSDEAMVARARLHKLGRHGRPGRPPPGARVFRLHSAAHYLECSEPRFAKLAGAQAELPVLVARKDGRSWWWFLDRFWWDDEGLTACEVRIIVLDAELSRKQQAEANARMRAALLGEESPAAPEPASQIVRFRAWCRDRGRCVDCGTAENIRFDEILPCENGGSATAANVELRCDGCRERRLQNQERARVDRARAVAAVYGA